MLPERYFKVFSRSYHDPVFIAFLLTCPDYQVSSGTVDYKLLELDLVQNLPANCETKNITRTKLGFAVEGVDYESTDAFGRYPRWLQYASAMLAVKKGIEIDERTATAIAKLLVRDYEPDKLAEISLLQFKLNMELMLRRHISDDYLPSMERIIKAINYRNVTQ